MSFLSFIWWCRYSGAGLQVDGLYERRRYRRHIRRLCRLGHLSLEVGLGTLSIHDGPHRCYHGLPVVERRRLR